MKTQSKIIGTPFKPGNKGKQPGTQNKVNRLVKDVVSDVFNHLQTDPTAKKKRADMKSWSEDYPKDFYAIAAKLIPVQMTHSGDKDNPIQLLFKSSTGCDNLTSDDS